MQYDIIGDVHGHAGKLLSLLDKLGYVDDGNGHYDPDGQRMAVFAMDLIDREAQQRRTVEIVQRMAKRGSALCSMGNHELNAIAYTIPDPRKKGEYLRPHTEKNKRHHAAFLKEFASDPDLYRETIDWFLSLPLWLDLPGFRVVHACWDQSSIDYASRVLLPGNRLDRELMVEATREGSDLYNAIETLTKGPEVALPPGCEMHDAEGTLRKRARTRWWDPEATTYRKAAMVPRSAVDLLPEEDLPPELIISYDNEKPLFFGHYWFTGKPQLISSKMACLDYSAARHGDLVAYCWDGETSLLPDRFFSSAMSRDSVPKRLPG